jgi:hypothetical protein
MSPEWNRRGPSAGYEGGLFVKGYLIVHFIAILRKALFLAAMFPV